MFPSNPTFHVFDMESAVALIRPGSRDLRQVDVGAGLGTAAAQPAGQPRYRATMSANKIKSSKREVTIPGCREKREGRRLGGSSLPAVDAGVGSACRTRLELVVSF